MSIPFRLDRLSLTTSSGDVSYEFPSALTVLAGPVGVGKSTLFELIKYGLGGKALLADIVERSVSSVSIEISIGTERYALSRSTLASETARVRVFDLRDQSPLPVHFIGDEDPSLSSLLLGAMGLPDTMRAAATTGATTNPGNRITFNDVIRYMYIPQGSINTQIAGSDESYYQPKRKAVFEILFDLTSPQILELQSQIARARGAWESAEHDFNVVLAFLKDSHTRNRADAQAAQRGATIKLEQARQRIESIRETILPVIDRETITLRDLLGEAEHNLADAKRSLTLLRQQRSNFSRELALIRQDSDRLGRLSFAGTSLAQIEFIVCPRCLQSVKDRSTPDNVCLLCLQTDPASLCSTDDNSPTYEQAQLNEQINELEAQIGATDEDITDILQAIESRQTLVAGLSDQINERTRERITPLLQSYADATAQFTHAETLLLEIEKTLLQWDRAEDLRTNVNRLRAWLQSLSTDLEEAQRSMDMRKAEVLDDLSSEFAAVVSDIGIPGVNLATISYKTYLPILNGKPLNKFSPDGGVRTATQVAYWVSLMNIALRRRETHYPAFLLIDSPRTSLNDSSDLSAKLYRKLVTMADAADGRVQVIIGDNELPSEYRRSYDQLDFDYDHPTIYTERHPGRDAVVTLNKP